MKRIPFFLFMIFNSLNHNLISKTWAVQEKVKFYLEEMISTCNQCYCQNFMQSPHSFLRQR